MAKRIKKVIVEVPHRISGFFEIVDKINGVKIDDPEKIGSRGAGFCLSAKGKTEISVEIIEQIRAVTSKPIVGIGGGTVDNLFQVIHAGAEGVAIISGILNTNNVEKSTNQYIKAIQKAKTMEAV